MHFFTEFRGNSGKVSRERPRVQRDGGSQFDRRLSERDRLRMGQMRGDVLHSPGSHLTRLAGVIGHAAFVGDTLRVPNFGTARCNLRGGSVRVLSDSVHKTLTLPDAGADLWSRHVKLPTREDFACETPASSQRG